MRKYILGTEDGLRWIHENNGVWEIDSTTALAGKKVLCGETCDGKIITTAYRDGVYLSENSGKSWNKVGDSHLAKVRCLRRAKWNGEEVLFTGTEPVGLYVSYNQGDSWNELSGVRRLHEIRRWTYPVPGVDPHVRDVTVDGHDTDSLYVSIQVGGMLVGRQRGQEWEEKREGLNPDVHRILMEPYNRSIFYAATGEEGIFVTEDGGNKWRRCGANFPWTYTIPFEICEPRYLIAGMGRDLPNAWTRRESGAEAVLAISKDGGENWSASFPGRPLSSMVMALSFTSPERDSLILGTGVTIGGATKGNGELYQVDLNSGQWKLLARGLPGINFIMALQ